MNQDMENTNTEHPQMDTSILESNSIENAGQKIDALINNIGKVVKGHREQIIQIITCLVAKGHILLEDNPGSGKTVMAKTLAYSLAGEKDHSDFKRIQFTFEHRKKGV